MSNRYLHVFFLASYQFFFLVAVNQGQVRIIDAVVPWLFSLGTSCILAMSFFYLYKNLDKGLLATTICLFFFYNFGALYLILSYFTSPESIAPLPFIGWLFLCFAVLRLLYRTNAELSQLHRFFNITWSVLVAMPLFSIVTNMVVEMAFEEPINDSKEKIATGSVISDLPDVYFVMLDGYARNDILKNLYAYDNSDFTNFLNKQGFYVADQSRANYSQTYLALSCALNLKLHKFENAKNETSRKPLLKMIQNSVFVDILKKAGYTTIAFPSGYTGTEMRSFDRYAGNSYYGKEFTYILLQTTLLYGIKFPFLDFPELMANSYRSTITRALKELPDVADTKPIFVFAHIVCPHPPFIFNRNGPREFTGRFNHNDGDHWSGSRDSYRQEYLEQLIYLNSLVKNTVTRLINNPRKKIIILQADHGPGSELFWEAPKSSNLNERMSILNAIYFHDRDYSRLYAGITPVNTFRQVVNKTFGTDLKLEEDKSYFSSFSRPYDFLEVLNR